jgi:hypothetical protein
MDVDDAVGAGAGAGAAPIAIAAVAVAGAVKRPATTATVSIETVRAWKFSPEYTYKANGDTCKKPNMASLTKIYGLHDGATPESIAAMEANIKLKGAVVCDWCGKEKGAHKSDLQDHWNTDTCITSGEINKFRFHTHNRDLIYRMALPHPKKMRNYKEEDERAQMLTIAALSARGVSDTTQAALFGRGKPVLRALARLSGTGLGSARDIPRSKDDAVKYMQDNLFKPVFDDVVAYKLPLALGQDGSGFKGGGGGEGELTFAFSPFLEKPLIIDYALLKRSPDADKLVCLMEAAATGTDYVDGAVGALGKPKFLTLEQYKNHLAVYAADHASVMTSAAEKVRARAVAT